MEKKSAITRASRLKSWARGNSLWTFCLDLSCCGTEFLAANSARYDLERFGCFLQSDPRNADVLIVAGPITVAAKDKILEVYDSMLSPKYVIAMGTCANTGGVFSENGNQVIHGVDKLVPVDVYIPGCPPRPEAIIHGIITLQKKIFSNSVVERHL